MNTESNVYQAYATQQTTLKRLPLVAENDESATASRLPNPPAETRQEPSPVTSPTTPSGYHAVKRAIDITGALLGLIFLFPVFVLISILVLLDSRGPVFHRRRVLARQEYRSGVTQTFDAFKFRTMVVDADSVLKNNPTLLAEYTKEYKLLEDPRVTRLGAKIRPLSIDEFPQLINILRGQMSLVGPRMITPPELAMYGPYAAKLLSVKPGLTGLWQVSGRTNVPYQERVRLDMLYIENRSILLDLQILWRTVGSVLARRGAV